MAINFNYRAAEFGVSASPGFTWGRSGTITTGAWLRNDTVPSNKAGRRIFLNDAQIVKVFISNGTVSTFDIGIYEHTGISTEVLLGTISVTASRGGEFDAEINATNGKELAIRVDSGTAEDLQVGLILLGDL